MSTTNKTALGVGIAAVLALIVMFGVRAYDTHQANKQADEAGLPTPASDTSDTALTQDSAAIDAQLTGLNQDSADADAGLSEAQ